jgi:hypothetical protein
MVYGGPAIDPDLLKQRAEQLRRLATKVSDVALRARLCGRAALLEEVEARLRPPTQS